MQKYYMREKSGRIKKGGYKNGRGYCGWYTNKDGKKMFLRSLKEYMYAKHLDKVDAHFLTECMSFEIDGVSYKPDFFIYSDKDYKELTQIVEIKDNKDDARQYFKYIDFFKNINIAFKVEYNVHKLKKYITKEERKMWIDSFVENYNGVSVAGKLNPMFGMKHSSETKRKIGEQTKRYMSDPEIKKRQRDSIKSFWDSDAANGLKDRYAKLRHAAAVKRHIIEDKRNPFEKRKCVICGSHFTCRESEGRETCKRNGCTTKLAYRNGKYKLNIDGVKIYKTRMLNYSIKIGIDNTISFQDFNNAVLFAKKDKIIPKFFSMTESAINKHFGGFENLKDEVKRRIQNGEAIKNHY